MKTSYEFANILKPREIKMPETPFFERVKVYQEIKRKICRRLNADWKANDRLPPIKDLALELNANVTNTHLAVKELVREGILVSRPRLGTFVCGDSELIRSKVRAMIHEVDSPLPPKPFEGKKIQLISYRNVWTSEFGSKAINPFIDTVSEQGCHVERTDIDALATGVDGYLDKKADAILFYNPNLYLSLSCFEHQVMVVVSSSSDLSMAMIERFDLISVDDYQGSCLAGYQFKQLGWADVAFIGVGDFYEGRGVDYDKVSIKRLNGLCQSLGHAVKPEWQFYCDAYTTYGGARAAALWLKLTERPRAIFAASDDIALGFIHGTLACGMLPGKDYQIIGFDSQREGPIDPDLGVLSTIAVPVAEMGALAARMMTERLDNPQMTPRRIYLGCSLVEGSTAVERL